MHTYVLDRSTRKAQKKNIGGVSRATARAGKGAHVRKVHL